MKLIAAILFPCIWILMEFMVFYDKDLMPWLSTNNEYTTLKSCASSGQINNLDLKILSTNFIDEYCESHYITIKLNDNMK